MKIKNAFTMLELIIVIVVVGILSAIMIPRFSDDKLREAADQIMSHIRYTQHLAMIDDQYDPNDQNWMYERWRINFRDCSGGSSEKYYVVFRDSNHGGASAAPGRNESAINPSDKRYLYNDGTCTKNATDSAEVLIGKRYGIDNITFTGGCTNQYIAFDNMGRPFSNTYGATPLNGLMSNDCNITFRSSDGNFTITIGGETGYVRLSSINY